jgi:YYY domain-containing protein
MDSAFLSATIRTDQMPPIDPWLAGETINYYYVGYALHGALARLSGVDSPVAFNLALITTTALALAAAVGCAGVALPRWGRYAGPLAAFFVVIAGNMEGPYRIANEGRAAWNASWWQGMGWNASRVVYDGTIQTINEFPAFSIILGDLHPHLITLPFTIVALAVAIAFARQPSPLTWPQLGFAGVLGGSLYALNSWDLPTYFGLILLAALWNLRGSGLRRMALGLATALVAALVAWAPFILTFTPFVAGDPETIPSAFRGVPVLESLLTTVSGNHFEFTSSSEFLRVFGLPYALILFTLVVAVGRMPEPIADSRNTARLGVPAGLLVLIAILANAPVLMLVGLPGIVAAWVLGGSGIGTSRGLVSTLYLAGAFIVLLTELFYIEDQFHNRMNTLFKAYYQVWTLWGIAAAVGIVWVFAKATRVEARVAVSVAIAGSLVLGLVYPVTSAVRWVDEFEFRYGGEWAGLDGSAYIGTLSEDELAGIQFIRANASADSVVLEAPGCSYQPISRIPFARVSAYTGVPTVLGWIGHESQWRSGDEALRATLQSRVDEAQGFYRAPNQELIDRYGIDFVYYGTYEQGEGMVPGRCDWPVALPAPDMEWMTEHGFAVVFQQGAVTIWQRLG